MGAVKERAIELLEQHGELVDIYYTQFLEVAFFLKVPASYGMVLKFLKKKMPQLSEQELSFLISEITSAYHDSE
tara:strand:- start:283 stop:504 length:222 start_codon:yes stop_codon:yes gene_type:complete